MPLRRLLILFYLEPTFDPNASILRLLDDTDSEAYLCIVSNQHLNASVSGSDTAIKSNRSEGYWIFVEDHMPIDELTSQVVEIVLSQGIQVIALDGDSVSMALASRVIRKLKDWTVLTQVTEIVRDKVYCVRSSSKVSEVYDVTDKQIQIWQRAYRASNSEIPALDYKLIDLTNTEEEEGGFAIFLTTKDLDAKVTAQSTSLEVSQRVMVVGAGVSDLEGVKLAEQVCEQLGMTLGATRVVTDKGWVDHQRQIGTTGVSIAPEIYVSFGVSGAIQHLGGVQMPERSIAVNTDPSAPIFQTCTYPIRSSAKETLLAITALMKQQCADRSNLDGT